MLYPLMELPICLKVSHEEAQKFFIPDNLTKSQDLKIFNGRYTLTIETYSTSKTTGQSTWEYTRGLVKDNDQVLFDVQRNYSSFLHVEFSHGGHDFMIVGTCYMKPTLLNLSERKVYPIENDSFCWTNARLSPTGKTLMINGCYWGGSYGYAFMDFGSIVDPSVPQEETQPALNATKKVKYLTMNLNKDVYLMSSTLEDEVDPEDPPERTDKITWEVDPDGNDIWKLAVKNRYYTNLKMDYDGAIDHFFKELNATRDGKSFDAYGKVFARIAEEPSEMLTTEVITMKRNGNMMEQVDHWKSDYFQRQELLREAYTRYWYVVNTLWKENCPLWQALKKEYPEGQASECWGGLATDMPGHHLFFILPKGESKVRNIKMQTKRDTLNMSEDWVLKHFLTVDTQDVHAEIVKQLDFTGSVYLQDENNVCSFLENMGSIKDITLDKLQEKMKSYI